MKQRLTYSSTLIRRTIIAGCLLMLCYDAFAQPVLKRPEYYIGAHGGIMASAVWFNPEIESFDFLDPLLSANGGLVFRYINNKVVGLQVELNYMQRGWKEPAYTTTVNETDVTHPAYYRRLDFIELPFLTHIYFGKRFRGFVNLGPQIGYCIADRLVEDQQNSIPKQHQPIDNRFDWGVAAGLGMYARTIAGVWQLEARFNFSLATNFSSSTSAYFNNSNNMNLSLNLAYMWQWEGR